MLQNANAISAGGYDINNSLRFRSSASAYLSRTPASITNRQTWTWSGWVKRGTLGTLQNIFSAGTASTDRNLIRFIDGLDTLQVFLTRSGATQYFLETTQVFRDPSAWYHIVITLDTTNATSTDRVRLYINGSRVTSFSSATYPSLSYAGGLINTTDPHTIARNPFLASEYLDGYLSEINFIDGQALTPSSFGETDTDTGSWKPKAYTGTYGTNGFYLKFSDIATTSGSNAGLGKDFSGNTNYWTTNNISVTAGTTYDAMIDSPTLTSATVANYCTLNPLESFTNPVPQQANLYFNGADYSQIKGTFWVSTGKWYFEWVSISGSLPAYVGVSNASITSNTNVTTSGISWYGHSNSYYKNFTGTSLVSASAISIGDIIGVAFDCDAGTVAYYKNNTLVHTDTTLTPNQLVAPTLIATFSGGGWSPAALNFGQRPFSYTPPTGYVALNTYNLPNSTVVKGNTVMDATLYTGNGTSQTITNAAPFRPDFVWIKSRSGAGYNHILFDSIRGATKYLSSNTTGAETTNTGTLTSFNSNGFSVSFDAEANGSSQTFVGWQWQAGQGTNTTNTSGSITSTVSVNATAGFSIVTYTGTLANATVGHGLGVAPAMIITRYRGSESWAVYHRSLGNTTWLVLNQTNAGLASSLTWNSTTPTSTVFSIGAAGVTNTSGGSGMVAYCWAEIAGFSKFGSYTGNGSADGPFVFTGFRPKWIMVKNTAIASNWLMYDTSRDTYNVTENTLIANTSGADAIYADVKLDILSNGFKIRQTSTNLNGNGNTLIYMAFAECPTKHALAR